MLNLDELKNVDSITLPFSLLHSALLPFSLLHSSNPIFEAQTHKNSETAPHDEKPPVYEWT